MLDNIFVNFNWKQYRLIFTRHWEERMLERWINIKMLIDSIENYDLLYNSFWKKVVEKNNILNIIRTVFSLKENNIILITSMKLWK